jgi:two-component system nitrogen regulation response regulator NtrX
VLVATHRNLEELVRHGTFRQDLFHRVFVFPLQLPPLRDRLDDIPLLAAHFAAQIAAQNGWKPRAFAPEALDALRHYAWPGNIRELRNVIERVLLLSSDEVDAASVQLALPQLSSAGAGASRDFGTAPLSSSASSGSLAERVEAFERDVLLAELKRNNHHMTNTARALGLERSHLYKKCQQLGIDLRAVRKSDS